ncbi:MAG: pyridoxine 5'-phosphate synthase [Limisphaerales bacterium]
MIKLGVNIDHVATIRQARYRGQEAGEPDPVAAALACEQAGAHGITAHLREDRRHIIDRDMPALRDAINTRLNFEMANTREIIAIALSVKPDIVCLVPEKREELTTEGGLDVTANLDSLRETTKRMHDAGIEVSLFVDPEPAQIDASIAVGSDFIELHTGTYDHAFGEPSELEAEISRLTAASEQAHTGGLQVNAGHGLNYENVSTLVERVPHLVELNIGHSIVSRSVFTGISAAVSDMLAAMNRK